MERRRGSCTYNPWLTENSIINMRYIFIILLLVSVQSKGQLYLYAENRKVDNSIDSFYTKILKDSVFNSQGVYVCPTVESFGLGFQIDYPQSFGQFIKYADGIYRNARYYVGYPVYTVMIHADAGGNLALTNQANSEQQLGNSLRSAVRVNTNAFQQARLTGIVMALSNSVNNPRIYFQYSTDGVNWIGGGNGISLSSTGAKETDWIDLPSGAIGDIYIRVAQNGGDGVADPAVGLVSIQFR